MISCMAVSMPDHWGQDTMTVAPQATRSFRAEAISAASEEVVILYSRLLSLQYFSA